MPKLSILIATFNAGKTLESCLESILSQHFKNYEILIADGFSNDATVSIIEKYKELIKYWHSKPDSGIYDAWNSLLIKADGDYICFLGADDQFHESSSLMNLFLAFEGNDFDLITSMALLIGGDKEHIVGGPWNYKNLWRRMGVIHPGMLHHRSLFNRYGFFDLKLKIVGDYEFLLRLDPETKSFHYDKVVTDIGSNGISRTQFKRMLLEKREVQMRCSRIGWLKANYNYINKLWRAPIARLLKLPY